MMTGMALMRTTRAFFSGIARLPVLLALWHGRAVWQLAGRMVAAFGRGRVLARNSFACSCENYSMRGAPGSSWTALFFWRVAFETRTSAALNDCWALMPFME